MSFKSSWEVLKATLKSFSEDRIMRLSAALAYYAIFSIGPLLVLVLGVAGLILGQEGIRQQVVTQIQGSAGPQAAETVQSMMSAQSLGGSLMATILGAVGLVLGATGIFGQLQDSLNTIWEVQPKPKMGLWMYIRTRILSLGMVLGIGFVLIISMALTGTVTALAGYVGNIISVPAWVIIAANAVLTFAIIASLFAVIFKYLPDVIVRWKAVWVGAIWTTLLFAIGQWVLGWYLGRQATTSAFGAAGSVVVILMYVYYSALIFFFGAELTKAYTEKKALSIEPKPYAVLVTEEQRAQEGRPTKQRVEESMRRPDERGDEGLRKAA